MSDFRRRLIMNNYSEESDYWLPKGCQDVEYLESTGTQYIDTGIFIDSYDYEWTTMAKIPTSEKYSGIRKTTQGTNRLTFGTTGSKYFATIGLTVTSFGVTMDESFHKFYIDIKNNKATLDNNTTKTLSGLIDVWDVSIMLFGIKDPNPITTQGVMSISNSTISKGGIVIQDLRPILDQNGTPCMYDIISKQYFYNLGTDRKSVV